MTKKEWMPIYNKLITSKCKVDYIMTNDNKIFYTQWKVKGRFKTFVTSYWFRPTIDCIRMNCSSNDSENYHKLIHDGIHISDIKYIKFIFNKK